MQCFHDNQIFSYDSTKTISISVVKIRQDVTQRGWDIYHCVSDIMYICIYIW